MPTFPHQTFSRFSPSFALISVLALVSLAALTATAFLASARLERQATTSIGNSTRLDMALESGKVAASQVILENSQTDLGNTHIVTYWRGSGANDWTNELGYPFIGQIKTSGAGGQQNATWYYYPLFSPAGVTNFVTNFIQTAMRFTNFHQGSFSNDMQAYLSSTNGTNGFVATPGLNHPKCVQIPLLGGRTSPPVGWVYINQEKRKLGSALTNTSPAVRIAWFTEDLEGLIDAERMGGLTTRPSGTNSEEISLSSATGTNGALLSSVATFTNNRKSYISYGLLSSASNGWSDVTNARYFASGLRSWMNTNAAGTTPNGAVAWIPVGIPISGSAIDSRGYTNQGYTKLNLNNLVSGTPASAVADIAATITNNLPNFTNRAGGMSGPTYVSNIAANIVDYVDTNGSPTTSGTYGTTDYSQGVDSYPWVNEVATRVTVQSYTVSSGNLVLNMRGFAELWNLSDKTFTGPITLTMNENDSIQAESATATTAPNTPLQTSGTLTTNITILPMQFKVVEVFSNLVTLTVPEPSGAGTKYVTWPTASTNSTFELKISGVTVQKPLGGLARRVDTSKTLTGNSDCLDLTTPALMETGANSRKIYRGNPLTHTNLASFDFMNEGDPRMTPFRIIGTSTSHTWATYEPGASYFMGNGRSSFGGWNTNSNLSQLSLTNLLEPSYPLTPGNMPTGPVNANGIFAVLPTSVVPIAPEPTKALQKLNNTGTFSNIFELGNIFDPVQWSFSSAVQPGGSIPATAVATGSAQRRGGGTTLRIGRAEHPRFAFTNMYGNSVPPIPNMSMSAAALLDLFATTNGTSVGDGPHSLGGGKINLNTAPAPVLRALAGGILLTKDPAQVPPNYAIPPAMAEAFAQGVMRFRSKYPFLTPSHLSFIGTDPAWPNTNSWPSNSVFGNTNTISLSTAPGNTFGSTARITVTEWSDQAAEEWFSKIYALSSCQSHNYRIYVVAQLVATNSAGQTNAIGPLVKKYFQIYMRNGSAVTGANTDSTYTGNPIYTWQPGGGGTIDIFKSTY